MDTLPRPTRARIGLAIVTAVTATLLLCQVLAVNAAEPTPPPSQAEKTAAPPKDAPKPEAHKRKKLKKVMPVDDFGDY